jgi:hypothetical protein
VFSVFFRAGNGRPVRQAFLNIAPVSITANSSRSVIFRIPKHLLAKGAVTIGE